MVEKTKKTKPEREAPYERPILDSGKEPDDLASAIDNSVKVVVKNNTKNKQTESRNINSRSAIKNLHQRQYLSDVRRPKRETYKPREDESKEKSSGQQPEERDIKLSHDGKTVRPISEQKNEPNQQTAGSSIKVRYKSKPVGTDSVQTNLYMDNRKTIGEIAAQLSEAKSGLPQTDEQLKESVNQQQASHESTSIEPAQETNGESEITKSRSVERENPKVFDTSEYHLPISTKRHKKGVSIGGIIVVIILLLSIAAAAAIYFDFVDIEMIKNLI